MHGEFLGGGEDRLVNLSVWPWMWAHALFGQPIAYNLVWLITIISSGLAMYLLVSYITDQGAAPLSGEDSGGRQGVVFTKLAIPAAPIVAGLYYMFLPFHLAHGLGHFGAMQTQWLPLAILLTLLVLRRPTTLRLAGLVIVLVVQTWTEHHYALWYALFAVLLVAWQWRRVGELLRSEKALARIVPALVLLALIVGFSYAPTIRVATSADNFLSLGEDQTVRFSADVASYVTPSAMHPVWGGAVRALLGDTAGNVAESTQYLGVIAVLLVIFFHQRIPKSTKWFWWWVIVFFGVLSLGPRLTVFGRVLPVPLPYALIDALPIFSEIRTIGRAGVMVGVALAVLLGWVVATTVRRQRITALLAAVLLFEFLVVPVAVSSAYVSPAYDRLSELGGTRVVEIPAATNYTVASQSLYASTVHGKDVVGSIALERAEDGSKQLEARSLPALRQLLYVRTGQLRERRPDFFGQDLSETLPDALIWMDASAIIVHVDSLSALQVSVIQSFLHDEGFISERHDDVLLFTQSTPPVSDGVFLSRDGRWEHVGFDPARDSVFAELPSEATTTLYNVTDQVQQAELTFTIPPEGHGNISVRHGETLVGDITAGPGEDATITIAIPPGAMELTWMNRLPSKAIIQNPQLRVTP